MPTISEMINEAIEVLQHECSNVQAIQNIDTKWTGVNHRSIRAAIVTLTVNHESRIHCP